jgi:3-hydroxyisobutyrate dehydrogenase
MVSDDVASRAVWLGVDGALAGDLAPDAFAIECSTLSHDWVRELSAAAATNNLRYLDCPVTGLPDAAAAGQLTLLVGGEPADVEAAEPLLRPLSVDRVHFGPVGAGTVYKLVINLMGAVQIAAPPEGMAMAERAGLDLDLVAATIAGGSGGEPPGGAQHPADGGRRPRDRRRVLGNLRRKDAAYGVRLAETLVSGAPFGRVALDGLDALVAAGLGDQNESSIIEVARRRAGDGQSSSSSRASQVASRSTGTSKSGFSSTNCWNRAASQATDTCSSPRRDSSSSMPRSVKYTTQPGSVKACSTRPCCSRSCFLCEPAAGEAEAGREMQLSPRPPSRAGRLSAMNGHGPWLAGSSCTHTSSACG